jgi:molybdate transport system substrate-binding protein
MKRAGITAALVGTLVASAHGGAIADTVTLAVASNFADVTRRLVRSFEETTGHNVSVSFGSTGLLYSQIANGAPFEVFLAADSARPKKAEDEGLALPGTRFTYATGRLVLWSPSAGAFENGETWVKTLAFSRAAIANPDIAPYGRAAREVLERLGVWEVAQSRLVRGENIAQTFQFVATGNADAGFVALSQVRAWRKDPGSLWEIPRAYYEPVVQQAVLLENGVDNRAARAFLEFLASPEARRVIAAAGYGVAE